MQVHFEDQDYEFSLEDIDVPEARYIKRQTGLSVKKFIEGLSEVDADCLVAAYWLMQKQNGKAVDMNKVNFKILQFAEAIGDAFEAEEKREAENPTVEPSEAQP